MTSKPCAGSSRIWNAKTTRRSSQRRHSMSTEAQPQTASLFEATVDDLTPDANNARIHNDKNIDMITRSIGEVGMARSVVIDEAGRVLAGNGTLKAAKKA